MAKTKWTGKQKIFTKGALSRELSAIPLKSAERMSKRLDQKQKSEKRSGTWNKRRNKRRSARGERYADDSGGTSASKNVRRIGDFKASLSFDNETAKRLIEKQGREVIKDSDEKEAQEYFEKEAAKAVERLVK